MNSDFKNCVKIAGCAFLLFLAINYWQNFADFISLIFGAMFPLIIGGIIAYLVNILMSFYERHYFCSKRSRFAEKSRRPVCLAGAYLTMIAIIALIISLVVPELVSCIRLIFEKFPQMARYLKKIDEWIEVIPEDVTIFLTDMDWQSRIEQIAKVLTTGIGSVMDGVLKTVSSVFSGTVTALLSVIFSIYVLLNKDILIRQFNCLTDYYMHKGLRNKIYYVLSVLNDCFRRFIVGQCTEAVILGVLCTLGMAILRIPYATMIGALVAFTALIPIAGAFIGAIVGAFMIMTVSPVKALVFLIFLIILQQLEENLIYPRVVGASIGLPGIWVLAAITVGGGVMGIAGMLLGVPLTAMVYRIIRNDMNKVIEEKTDETHPQ